MTGAAAIGPLDPAGTSRFVQVDGIDIHYHFVDGPEDTPPVIFTHGGGPGSTGWNNFLYNARAIAARHRCYFYDMPQSGRSAKIPISGPAFSWHADKLRGFMDSLGIRRAHLVNQSQGGCAAIRLAASWPDRVDRMIIIAAQPVLRGVTAPMTLFTKHAATVLSDYYLADSGPSPEKMRALIAKLEFHDDSAVTDLNVRLRYEASTEPGLIDLIKTTGALGQWENLAPVFPEVRAPTLIFWGLHDWFGGIDVPMLMVNQFADARLYVIGAAGHHLQTECPEEFNAIALTFLGQAQ